jgi:uncharacterized protein (UPF0332 family)
MITEEQRELIEHRLEQAQNALQAAEALRNQGLLRDATNRSYYAMFYGVLALLGTKGMGTSKHAGAISLFDREFVKAGIFSKELSMRLHEAFKKRLEMDYGETAPITLEEATALIEQASIFLDAIKAHLRSI